MVDNKALGDAGALGMFSILNIVALALIFLLVEETSRIRLEELDQLYERPKREFIANQATENLPWLIKRYILRRDDKKKPYYLYDESVYGTDGGVSERSVSTCTGDSGSTSSSSVDSIHD